MGSSIIELRDIWNAWFRFRQGKKYTTELHYFQYYLERNLQELCTSIEIGLYKHGFYRHFIVNENKKRTIRVATLRDRVMHRLIYDYLVEIFDKTFIFDVWSCRKGKGLIGAVARAHSLLQKNSNYFVWRTDITKFFDSVDHTILRNSIARKVKESQWFWLIDEIIKSYSSYQDNPVDGKGKVNRGIPIGNLTSQIFANIYLNELDFYVTHTLKPQGYMRYGDDFIVISRNIEEAVLFRESIIIFLRIHLSLQISAKHDILIPVRQGIRFLGCYISPFECRLNRRNIRRIDRVLNQKNASSYYGIVARYETDREMNYFHWKLVML